MLNVVIDEVQCAAPENKSSPRRFHQVQITPDTYLLHWQDEFFNNFLNITPDADLEDYIIHKRLGRSQSIFTHEGASNKAQLIISLVRKFIQVI